MKVLFVWPNKDNFGFKPIALALLTAILKRQGHSVRLFDTTFIDFGFTTNTECMTKIKIFKSVNYDGYDINKKSVDLECELIKMLDDFCPDVVCISALSDEVSIGFEISNIVKDWNDAIPVLWGNKAATMSPEKILSNKNIDYVCIGEGINFIIEFVDCLSHKGNLYQIKNIAYRKDNQIIRNELYPFFQDLDNLPFYDWSIFDHRHFLKPYDGKLYIGGDYMMYWGCSNKCTYCINHAYRKLYGQKAGNFLRWYSIDRIIKELGFLIEKWGINFFKFYDEDFCIKSNKYFHQLTKAYSKNIKIPFVAMANAKSITEEKAELLAQMGCTSISIGIETGNSYIRREVLKRKESKEDIIRAFQILHNVGIRTSSFNMLGLPFETKETIEETIDFNRESQVRFPNATFFYPLEGTELRQLSIKEGFFKNIDDIVFDNTLPSLTLPGITTGELIAFRDRFILYIKMPKEFYKYIEKSKQLGNDKLLEELYRIYSECVLQNGGIWDDKGKNYLKDLVKYL